MEFSKTIYLPGYSGKPTVSMGQLLGYLQALPQDLPAFTVSGTAGILLLVQHNFLFDVYRQSYNRLLTHTHTSTEAQLQAIFLCL